MFPYHILVTLDRNYLKVLSVMLYSFPNRTRRAYTPFMWSTTP